MTHNTKAAGYGALLETHKPRVITSQREHARQLKLIDKLMRQRKRSADEDRLLDLLVTLVERYDAENYPVPNSPPGRMLGFLLQQRGLSQAALADAVGISRQLVTEIIKGRSAISPENIRRFSDYFQVSPELFVPPRDALKAATSTAS